MNFAESDAQRGSPFFTKLPPEIRRQIFINLFGGSRVHVVFSNHKNKSFRREDQPKGPFPRFYHCVCRHQNDAPPHKLHEGNHKRRYLSTHILFTCKWAYQTDTDVLYHTNTFMFDEPMDLSMFNRCTSPRFDRVKSVEVNIPDLGVSYSSHQLEKLNNVLSDCSGKFSLRVRLHLCQLRGTILSNIARRTYRPWDLRNLLVSVDTPDINEIELFLPVALKADIQDEMASYERRWARVVRYRFEENEIIELLQPDGTEPDGEDLESVQSDGTGSDDEDIESIRLDEEEEFWCNEIQLDSREAYKICHILRAFSYFLCLPYFSRKPLLTGEDFRPDAQQY
ncbi:hypothetical protein ACLX1H_004250 [Fusarium chlamydosporum]